MCLESENLPLASHLTAEGQTQPPQFWAAAVATSSLYADVAATIRAHECAYSFFFFELDWTFD